MFGTLLAVGGAVLAVAAISIVGLIAWSIRREDTANTLAGRPAHPVHGIARSLMDVHFSGIISPHDAPQQQFTVRGRIHVDGHHGATTRPQHTPRPRI